MQSPLVGVSVCTGYRPSSPGVSGWPSRDSSGSLTSRCVMSTLSEGFGMLVPLEDEPGEGD